MGKYVERIGKGMETISESLVRDRRGGPDHRALVKLGADLALLKKNIDPATNRAIDDPVRRKESLVLKALSDAGIRSLAEFNALTESAVQASWRAHVSRPVLKGGPLD